MPTFSTCPLARRACNLSRSATRATRRGNTTVQSDNTSGYGPFAYDFKMGQYDVTVAAQYVAFLNTVASTADPYGLYSGNMEAASGALINIGIMQSYTKKNGYSYSFDGSATRRPAIAPCPTPVGVTARFCNWLQNGQPTGPEGPGTTETGAYTLGGITSHRPDRRNATRAHLLHPLGKQWYKAAYYNPAKGNYWAYPTQSNTAPSNVLSATARTAPTTSMAATRTRPTSDAGGGVCPPRPAPTGLTTWAATCSSGTKP